MHAPFAIDEGGFLVPSRVREEMSSLLHEGSDRLTSMQSSRSGRSRFRHYPQRFPFVRLGRTGRKEGSGEEVQKSFSVLRVLRSERDAIVGVNRGYLSKTNSLVPITVVPRNLYC